MLVTVEIADAAENPIPSQDIQVARLEMMLEISRILNTHLDLDTLTQYLLETATQLTDSETACLLLLDTTQDMFSLLVKPEMREQPPSALTVPMEGSIAGWILKHGEPLVIDNMQADKRHFNEVNWVTHLKVKAMMGVPLAARGKLIGVLEVANKRDGSYFSGEDLSLLTMLADQAAVALDNARLFEQSDQLVTVFEQLRSPLTAISGFSQIVLENPDIDPTELRAGVENINQEADRLGNLIEVFFELSKIDSGRIRMEREPVDLQEITRDVVAQYQPQADAQSITLTMTDSQPIPTIKADGARLQQVIAVLLDNALAYNRADGLVEVMLTCNEVRLQLSVRDTGIGLAPNNLELVFDKFYRVEGAADKARGAGLGLALAKTIIEAHDGDIWVESALDEGSTFTFSLPLG